MASTSLVSSVWTMVLSLPLMLASASAEHCPAVLCGDVSIVFPFGIVQEQATNTNCGAIGFQVRCVNDTPYLGYGRQDHWLQILTVFYENASLVVADSHKVQKLGAADSNSSAVDDDDDESCRIPKNNSSTKVALPFSISPLNQDLILYDCTKALAPATTAADEGLVETRCGNSTFARIIGGRYGESDGRYFLDGCGATVVPVLGNYGETNASYYQELIGAGFLLTWRTPNEYIKLQSCTVQSWCCPIALCWVRNFSHLCLLCSISLGWVWDIFTKDVKSSICSHSFTRHRNITCKKK